MVDIKEVLSNSYCSIIRDQFNESFIEQKEELSAEIQEIAFIDLLEQYETQKEEIMQKWANTPIDELGGTTPTEKINSIQEFSEVFELFIYMIEHTDEDVPSILIERLKDFGHIAIQALSDLANAHLDNQDDIFLVGALSALAEFRTFETVKLLIDKAYQLNEKKFEIEHVEEALISSGPCVIEPILEIVESKQMEDVEKMLLYVLSVVSSDAKDERIYRILKSAFREADDKMHAVICIGEYGDGRAVPMLRGYLQKNSDIERDLYYEIVGTIQQLGGRVDEFL